MTSTIDGADLAWRPEHVPVDRVFSFDMYNPDGIDEVGYLQAWKRLQELDLPEMIWTPYNGGHWIATRGHLIREIYKDPERFSSAVIFIPKAAGEQQDMVPNRMDPPEHRPYREVVDKGLNLRSIRTMEDSIRAEAISLIDSFVAKGTCDFGRDFSDEFPIRVFMQLADLPIEDAARLRALAGAMTRPDGNTPEEMGEALAKANKGFFAYLEPIIDARAGKGGSDLISLSVNSTVNGQPIARDKLLGMISLLLLAGLDSVTNFMNMMMDYLGRHPDLVAQLEQNPEIIKRSVEEMFRRFPLVAAARMVAADIDYEGVKLKQGEMVLLPTPLHGLDEAENPNPWELDFKRKNIAHSTFGDGPHRCAGLHLARLEATVMLEEWLKRIPRFEVVEGSQPTYRSGIVASVEGVLLTW
jgi:camphor 5-monooxygenase